MTSPDDVRLLGKAVEAHDGRDSYLAIRKAFEAGPIEAARTLVPILMRDPSSPDGLAHPLYYQEPVAGHVLFQTYDEMDFIWSTGLGKTWAVSMGAALKMFLQPEQALIVAPYTEQTQLIKDTTRGFFEGGHQIFRDALLDSTQDRVHVQRPDGGTSRMFCRTANINNEGKTLLGIQGVTSVYLDERAEIPDEIWHEKIDRITAPQGRTRMTVGLTTPHVINHVYEHVEGSQLPPGASLDDQVHVHTTKRGNVVFKATYKCGLKAGRYTKDFIDSRYAKLGPEGFATWYQADFPRFQDEVPFPSDLIASVID